MFQTRNDVDYTRTLYAESLQTFILPGPKRLPKVATATSNDVRRHKCLQAVILHADVLHAKTCLLFIFYKFCPVIYK